MSQRPIMDVGPGINFFSLNRERLLFSTLGPLTIPEVVELEIRRKAGQEQRFAAAARVLNKLSHRWLEVLPDDTTEQLTAVIKRIAGMPMHQRTRSGKDLGELMVVAHAVVAAEHGNHVRVLIDDTDGRKIAGREAARLQRLNRVSPTVGSIALVSTVTVLKSAAGGTYLPNRNAMRDLYTKMRALDDGLIPLEQTDLMDLEAWKQA